MTILTYSKNDSETGIFGVDTPSTRNASIAVAVSLCVITVGVIVVIFYRWHEKKSIQRVFTRASSKIKIYELKSLNIEGSTLPQTDYGTLKETTTNAAPETQANEIEMTANSNV